MFIQNRVPYTHSSYTTLNTNKCLHDEFHLITGVEPVTSTQGNTAKTFSYQLKFNKAYLQETINFKTLFRQLVQPFNYNNSKLAIKYPVNYP